MRMLRSIKLRKQSQGWDASTLSLDCKSRLAVFTLFGKLLNTYRGHAIKSMKEPLIIHNDFRAAHFLWDDGYSLVQSYRSCEVPTLGL